MTPPLADPPLGARLSRLWTESFGWIAEHINQIAFAALLGVAIVALLVAARSLASHLCRSGTGHWHRVVGGALARIRLWFMLAFAAEIVSVYSGPPGDLARAIHFLFVVAAALQAAIVANVLIIGFVEERANDEDGHPLASAMGVIRRLVAFTLFAVATILILSNIGVNVTGLVAGLGIGGIAIGLAAQGIFADLFAAFAILLDRPFRRGDAIRYGTTTGNVEAIGLKSTRIRAQTGELVIIANKDLLSREIYNLARLDRRRIAITLGLAPTTAPHLLEALPETIRALVQANPNATLIRAGLTELAATLKFEVQYDVTSEDPALVFATQHAINLSITKRCAELGITFA